MATATTPTPPQIFSALTPASAGDPAYYGMVMLGMASQAYTEQGNTQWTQIQQAFYTAITNTSYTPSLPSPPALAAIAPVVAGNWTLDWGPANGQNGDGDNSNLIYIASYRALAGNPNYAMGQPYFFVVGIRGTDTSETGLPLYQQLAQDIRDFELMSWPAFLLGVDILDGSVPTPNTKNPFGLSGQVAHGSLKGFSKIANFTAPLNNGNVPADGPGAVPVVKALNSLLARYHGTPIVVTGHSLGAAQTQLMASYLAWQFPQNSVIPYAYAPPTVGDANFVATYSKQCPQGQFWYNQFDVVPYAYITLPPGTEETSGLAWAAKNLWTSYKWPMGLFGAKPPLPPDPVNPSGQPGPPLPQIMIDLIDTIGQAIPAVYERPANGVFGLAGNIPPLPDIVALLAALGGGMEKFPPDSGMAQLVWQHFPPCYAALMTAQYGPALGPFAFKAYKLPPAPG